jgi:hypothetical protein
MLLVMSISLTKKPLVLKILCSWESGCPAKRNGHTSVGTGLSNNPKGLASFYPTSNRYLLTVDGTSLKYLNGTVWTAISGASFSTAKNATFCQARGNLYIHNGTDAVRKLDSTLTLTAPTTTVSSSFGIFWNGRQWASGVAAHPLVCMCRTLLMLETSP